MNAYIEKLKQQLAQNPPDFGGAESVIDLLYLIYTEFNPINNQEIRDGFERLRNHFPDMDLQDFDVIFVTVSELCTEHERLAFIEGFRLGITLSQELTKK